MRTAVFSIVSPNYWHYARVLMGSLQRNHPEWDRFILCVGEPPASGADGEPFTAVPLAALPLPNPRQFCFRYTLLELNTAVKPWMFARLFEQGYDRVVFLDPDVYVYSRMAELDEAPAGTFLMLTPHLTGFIGGDEHPSERTILQAGTYNLGFLAVSRRPQLARFLAWWQEKLEYQCLVDQPRGLFVDQRWMDLAPGLFPDVAILRHEGYNVAYWNLKQRRIHQNGAGATVNGQPLRFFHFSGLDPDFTGKVSRHDASLELGALGDARRLVEDYRAALHAAGHESFRSVPYPFGRFSDGTKLPDAARISYRSSIDLQAACGSDPFAHAGLFNARTGTAFRGFLSQASPLARLVPRTVRKATRKFLRGH